jgi:drug/metabolite transporter (DMT)-like permease
MSGPLRSDPADGPMPRADTPAALWLATLALVALTAMSACIHEAAKVAPVGQLMFWRSAVALVPILLYMMVRRELPRALLTRVPGRHLVRGLLGAGAMFLSFTSLAYLSVGPATALSYLAPIFSIAAAMLLLRERPGASVFLGVLLGFGGILVMLMPSLLGAELREGALVGIAAGIGMAAMSALSRVQVKDLTRTEPASAIAFYFAVIAGLIGLATAPLGWAELAGPTLLLLVGAGLLGGVAHVAMSEAVARTQVSILAPFEYTGIVWAFLFDLLFLQVALQPLSVTGALMVVAAAALVALARSRALPAPEDMAAGAVRKET